MQSHLIKFLGPYTEDDCSQSYWAMPSGTFMLHFSFTEHPPWALVYFNDWKEYYESVSRRGDTWQWITQLFARISGNEKVWLLLKRQYVNHKLKYKIIFIYAINGLATSSHSRSATSARYHSRRTQHTFHLINPPITRWAHLFCIKGDTHFEICFIGP